MNKISQNGMQVTQTKDSIIVNGVEFKLPEKVKKSGTNRMSMINGKITINGYVFNPETGEFNKPIPWFLILVLVGVLYFIFN